jgi:hypothetical protein
MTLPIRLREAQTVSAIAKTMRSLRDQESHIESLLERYDKNQTAELGHLVDMAIEAYEETFVAADQLYSLVRSKIVVKKDQK